MGRAGSRQWGVGRGLPRGPELLGSPRGGRRLGWHRILWGVSRNEPPPECAVGPANPVGPRGCSWVSWRRVGLQLPQGPVPTSHPSDPFLASRPSGVLLGWAGRTWQGWGLPCGNAHRALRRGPQGPRRTLGGAAGASLCYRRSLDVPSRERGSHQSQPARPPSPSGGSSVWTRGRRPLTRTHL